MLRRKVNVPFFDVTLRRPSLSEHFFLFVVVVPVMLLSGFLYHSWQTYNSRIQYFQDETIRLSGLIELELTNLYSYVTHVNMNVGRELAANSPENIKNVTKTSEIETKRQITQNISNSRYNERTLFLSAIFHPSRPDNLRSVDSNIKSKDSRNFTADNLTIEFSAPIVDNTSGKPVLPVVVNFNDYNNQGGFLVENLDITEISKHIENIIASSGISYLVVDNNLNIIAQSADNSAGIFSNYYKAKLQAPELLKQQDGEVSFTDEAGHINYTRYNKISGYPYVVFTGTNKNIAAQAFDTILLPEIIKFLSMFVLLIAILYMLRRQILQPIQSFAQAADKIAAGKNVKKMPRSNFVEFADFSRKIIQIVRHISKEKRHRYNLEKARQKDRKLFKAAHDSDRQKDLFLRDLYHAMNNPLNVVIAGAEMLRNRTLGDNMHLYEEYFEMIYKAGREIESFATDILNPSAVNVKELIKRCVLVQNKKANESNVKIEINIDAAIQPIIADELRLSQIIISVIGHSLLCIQDGGTVKISAMFRRKKAGEYRKLIIQVEDDGLGSSERERVEDWERAFGDTQKIYSYSRNPDATSLSFPVIRHLISLHKGTFELKTITRVGSVFTIILPYLTKKELETNPKEIALNGGIGGKLLITKNNKSEGGNIIKFPRKD